MTEGNDINWFEIRAEKPGKQRQPPRWQRMFGITFDGVIYVSAVLSGRSEIEVMLCAGYDGTSGYESKGHIYVPLDWLEREFPHKKFADTYDLLREVIKNGDYRNTMH